MTTRTFYRVPSDIQRQAPGPRGNPVLPGSVVLCPAVVASLLDVASQRAGRLMDLPLSVRPASILWRNGLANVIGVMY